MKYVMFALPLMLLMACSPADSPEEAPNAPGLSEFELEHGIGPVKQEVVLGEIDAERVALGKSVFEVKCTACHKVGERYIGPDLAGVTQRRSPTYVMNMILNPSEMTQKHPDARSLLAEFLAPMPFQNVTEEDARNIVEYLRNANQNP